MVDVEQRVYDLEKDGRETAKLMAEATVAIRHLADDMADFKEYSKDRLKKMEHDLTEIQKVIARIKDAEQESRGFIYTPNFRILVLTIGAIILALAGVNLAEMKGLLG